MALTDEVAARMLGEIYTITTRIDDQNKLIIRTADDLKSAADLINRNSVLAVNNAQVAVKLAQEESLAIFEQDMFRAAAKALNHVAGAVATKSAARWVVGGVALAGILAIFSGWVGYSQGKDAGISFGYAQASNEIAAAAWANTPDGRLAYQLAKTGSLEYLAHCSRPGWKKEGNICYAYAPETGGIYGWYVP